MNLNFNKNSNWLKLSQNKSILSVTLTSLLCLTQPGVANAGTIITQWNDAALEAIRLAKPAPTVVARALAIANTCMYDAWAAYDAKANGTRYAGKLRRPASERTDANKTKAISFAASACLADLFPAQKSIFDTLMVQLAYNPLDRSTLTTLPSSIGNLAAAAVLSFRHQDGSNQLGDLNTGLPYSDYSGYVPVNSPAAIIDPSRWQPLFVNNKTQSFATPQWGMVTPYSLKSGQQFRSIIPLPANYATDSARYRLQAQEILDMTAKLNDKTKVIAEYWADGPSSELPPGHWTLMAGFISSRDKHSLNDDAKMYFALTNAMFDSCIVVWDAKRYFDSVRPVTAIRFLYTGAQVLSWNGVVDGANWMPYQPANIVTPGFAEYLSGHSSFSASAAETLKSFTGSDAFGFSVTIPQGSSRVEPGLVPALDTKLSWATFSAAADEAGISRRYGGIHFKDGDLESRKIGRLVGKQAWIKSQSLFNP